MSLPALRWTLVALALCLLAVAVVCLNFRNPAAFPSDAWFPWLDLAVGIVGLALSTPRRHGHGIAPAGVALMMAAALFALWVVADAVSARPWLTWTHGGLMLVTLVLGIWGANPPAAEQTKPEQPLPYEERRAA